MGVPPCDPPIAGLFHENLAINRWKYEVEPCQETTFMDGHSRHSFDTWVNVGRWNPTGLLGMIKNQQYMYKTNTNNYRIGIDNEIRPRHQFPYSSIFITNGNL